MFKSFPHNTFQLMYEMGVEKKNMKAAAWLLLAPAIIGGLGASMATAILKKLITAVMEAIPGVDAPDDPEEAFYEWIDETFGSTAARTARFGLTGGLLNVSVKGTLQNRLEDWIPRTFADFLGAPVAAVTDIVEGGYKIARGDVLKGLEQLGPRASANVIRAYREYTEGVTGRGNQPLHYGLEPMKANLFEAILRSVGFNPATLAEMREKQWNERQVERAYADRRRRIYDRLRRYYLLPEDVRNDDHPDWIGIMSDAHEYNARVDRRKMGDTIPKITRETMRTAVRPMFMPPKRERVRAMSRENP